MLGPTQDTPSDPDDDDGDEEHDGITITLGVMECAEVCNALAHYALTGCKDAPESRADVLRLLQNLDQAMTGDPEPTPVEELLRRIQGQGEEEDKQV